MGKCQRMPISSVRVDTTFSGRDQHVLWLPSDPMHDQHRSIDVFLLFIFVRYDGLWDRLREVNGRERQGANN